MENLEGGYQDKIQIYGFFVWEVSKVALNIAFLKFGNDLWA